MLKFVFNLLLLVIWLGGCSCQKNGVETKPSGISENAGFTEDCSINEAEVTLINMPDNSDELFPVGGCQSIKDARNKNLLSNEVVDE